MTDDRRRAEVLRQIEFYLSDLALPYDEFFKAAFDKGGGAIPLETLVGAPRIIKLLDGLDAAARQAFVKEVVEAESDTVRIVDEDKLGRIYPLPSEDPKATCSVYLSGCAKNLDSSQLTAQLESSRAAYGSEFLPVVSMRRLRDLQRDRAYSGQLIVECENGDKAEALVRAANKGACGIPCNKAKLLKDFYDKQHECALEQRAKIAAKRAAKADGSGGGGAAGEKRPRTEETAEEAAEREKQEAAAAEADRLLVLKFEGAGAEADREAVEALLAPLGLKPAYINYSRGESTGHVRFSEAGECKVALDALAAGGSAHGAKLGGEDAAPTWRMLTAEESAEYWAAYRDRKKDSKRQRSGGGKGRGGKGFGRGGKGKGGGRRSN